MNLFKSGNPVLSDSKFDNAVYSYDYTETMTVKGTMQKFGFLALLTLAASTITWMRANDGNNVQSLIIGGAIAALILSFIIVFKKEYSMYLSPAYAILKGLVLGGVSFYYNAIFKSVNPNLILQAITITFSVVLGMYLLYTFKIIQATQKFKSIVLTATMGIFIFYIVAFGLSFFNIHIPFLHQGSTIGIIFSIAVVILAALNLILDFDQIEYGASTNQPKFMEWYGAFGLLVTIVWLYMEILRLLAKLNSRD